ncbi:MAG: bifunctional riboflavin kinase/FAD synthetase [Acidimicrobiales bacterium]
MANVADTPMDVIHGVRSVAGSGAGSAVTIGAYDGVHRGHRHVLSLLADMARPRGLRTVVVTFDRHPATVVRPDSAPLLLTDLEQKLELLAAQGVDTTMVVPFDQQRAEEPAEDFVTEVLEGALQTRLLVVGKDFHFGHGRKGDLRMLEEMGESLGFQTVGVELDEAGAGEVISSTRIRGLLAEGDVRGAARLLGRYHQVRGTVVRGDGRGAALLGFPTANVAVPEGMAVAAEGIYACFYERPDGVRHGAAVSLGRRPTFADATPGIHLEAYVLDLAEDLYDEPARVSFVQRLRPDRRFESAAELVEQMRHDVEHARSVLAAEPAA